MAIESAFSINYETLLTELVVDGSTYKYFNILGLKDDRYGSFYLIHPCIYLIKQFINTILEKVVGITHAIVFWSFFEGIT